jgi:hypothetical protein
METGGSVLLASATSGFRGAGTCSDREDLDARQSQDEAFYGVLHGDSRMMLSRNGVGGVSRLTL